MALAYDSHCLKKTRSYNKDRKTFMGSIAELGKFNSEGIRDVWDSQIKMPLSQNASDFLTLLE